MLDIIGEKFNRLLVIKEVERRGYYRYFECKCDCGNEITTRLSNLIRGASKSCGCLQKEQARKLGLSKRRHGMCKTRFYKIWKGLFTRCNNKNAQNFYLYGGRGIKISYQWYKFENFRDDMLNDYKDNLTIERINNDGNYEPKNCRWATIQEQSKNRRMQKLTKESVLEIRKDSEYKTGRELAKKYGVCEGVISEIINFRRNYGFIK